MHSSAGLYRHAAARSPVKRLRHIRLTPQPGYFMEVWKKPASGEAVNVGILFSPAEALGLMLAIEQSMSVLAFGVPSVIPRGGAALAAQSA